MGLETGCGHLLLGCVCNGWEAESEILLDLTKATLSIRTTLWRCLTRNRIDLLSEYRKRVI